MSLPPSTSVGFELFRRSLLRASLALWITGGAIAAHAQSAIPFLPHVDVALSYNGTGPGGSAVTFNSATQNLNCPASGIVAKVSSTTDGKGNVLVDNFVNLTVTQGAANPVGPINICSGGIVENGGQNDCFTSGYQVPAGEGQLTGDDPDGAIAASGGIAPIDIGASLAGGPNTVTLGAVDTGGFFASTSLYLYTNCTSTGAVGGGTISGNPIPANNPPASALTQSFPFNSATGGVVEQIVDFSYAANANSLTIPSAGSTPTVTDKALSPLAADWGPYVAGTSFATAQCLIHNGESLNGSPACKLYTLTCQIGQNSAAAGANCPTSSERNEVIEDIFDGPAFTLPDLHYQKQTFHQGIGYLMAKEGWNGGPCAFDPDANQVYSCPENLLTEFVGPGTFNSQGTTKQYNSSFVSIAPVPLDATQVSFGYPSTQKWTNHRTVTATFLSTPPTIPPPNNNFVAAPIASITYGVSPINELPSTEFPVPGDLTLASGVPCTTVGGVPPPPAQPFSPSPVPISVPADGRYFVHYFATDCAGTEELGFYQDGSGSWHTFFFTAELFVDTVAPFVVSGPTLSPVNVVNGVNTYTQGQVVTASFQCADGLSGVATCGTITYANPVTTPPVASHNVLTNRVGNHTFAVHVFDAAGNEGAPKWVNYVVIGAP